MQNLSFRYTRWVNWRHARIGHLFQGRYKAILVDGDAYLLELVRYIHLNPVRARLVDIPEEWPWSGHRAYIGKEKIPWLCAEMTLTLFDRRRSIAVTGYSEFIVEGMEESRRGDFHGEGLPDGRVLGDEEFVQYATGEKQEKPSQVSVDAVICAICRKYGIEPEVLALPGKRQKVSHVRGMTAWVVQDLPACTLKDLSLRMGRDISSLSAMAGRLQRRACSCAELQREKEELIAQITRCKA